MRSSEDLAARQLEALSAFLAFTPRDPTLPLSEQIARNAAAGDIWARRVVNSRILESPQTPQSADPVDDLANAPVPSIAVAAQSGAEPYDVAGGVNIPMLILHGTEDERAPMADMCRMQARMRHLGKDCTFVFYDGARHGFAVRTHPGYAEDAAKQSFDEAKRFLARYLPVTG